MSNLVWTPPTGLGWSVFKTPTFRTIVQNSASGKEVRAALWSNPTWQFKLTWSYLRDFAPSGAYTDLRLLMGFFLARQGSFDDFLYSDPTDNNVTGQSIGTGNGSLTAFQLTRDLGTFLETMQNISGNPIIYLAGVSIPQAGLAVPAAPTLSQVAGGSIGATTYFVKITYVTNSGETLASSESSLAVSANNLLKVTSPGASSGAIGWNVYVSTASGTETKQNGATAIAIGTSWTEPTTGLVSGAALPAANTTGWSMSGTGLVTFLGPVVNAIAVTADFSYFYRVRFAKDLEEFEEFMNNLWTKKTLELISLKQ